MIDFEMFQGDSKNIIISITDVSDLTGASVKWVVKKRVHVVENILLKTTGNGITVNGNEITIRLVPTDTSNLDGTFYHECEVTDAQGNVSTVKTGYFGIKVAGI